MKLTIIKLFQDVSYFIRNYYHHILMLILITTLIQLSLNYILVPKKEELTLINNLISINLQDIITQLSLNQQYILIKLFIANGISKLLSSTFLLGTILTILHVTTTNQLKLHKYYNILKIIKLSLPLFPKLSVIIFFMSLLIQIGLILAIIPGILLAIFMSTIPIIIITDNISIIKSIHISIKLSLNNIHLIAPVILIWFIIKIMTTLILLQYDDIKKFFIQILSDNIINTLLTIIIIYLYRLYMITKST